MKPPRHLRRLLPYLKRHRAPLLVGLGCLLLRTVFSVASPWVLRYAVDDLTLGVTRDKLLAYAGILVGVVTVEGFFLYQMRMILIGVSREIEYELRGDLFAHLTRLPARYYHGVRTGDLMSRATSDLSAVRMVLGPGIMYTASTLATFVGTIALMVTISPWLLGLSLVPLLFVTVLVRYFGRRIHERFEAVQAQLSNLSALVQENLSGARVVRAYVQEAARDGALRGRQRGVPEAQPRAHPDVRQPVPGHPAPHGDERRLRALAGRAAWSSRAPSPSGSSWPLAPTSPCSTGR